MQSRMFPDEKKDRQNKPRYTRSCRSIPGGAKHVSSTQSRAAPAMTNLNLQRELRWVGPPLGSLRFAGTVAEAEAETELPRLGGLQSSHRDVRSRTKKGANLPHGREESVTSSLWSARKQTVGIGLFVSSRARARQGEAASNPSFLAPSRPRFRLCWQTGWGLNRWNPVWRNFQYNLEFGCVVRGYRRPASEARRHQGPESKSNTGLGERAR
ncbi:hypothetical protein IWX47DRAFT_530911 [Phyllosticta citricarpa]